MTKASHLTSVERKDDPLSEFTKAERERLKQIWPDGVGRIRKTDHWFFEPNVGWEQLGDGRQLYAAPADQPKRALPSSRIMEIACKVWPRLQGDITKHIEFARAIEQALEEK